MSGRTAKRQRARKINVEVRKTAPALPIVAVSAVVCFFPLLVYWREFSRLFYFHDDFTLLHELGGTTLLRWIVHPFAGESIVPLFKLLWIAAVWSTGGSYLALIVIQWLTHAAICFAFGTLLLRLRIPPVAAAFAVLTFGLPSSNIETLGWSMQWCSQLSMLFLLLAWHALLTILERPAAARLYGWYLGAIVASSLCSSRGIITGLVLAAFLVFSGEGRRRVWLCAASVAPTVLLVTATWIVVPPFKETHVGHIGYSLTYLALNPLSSLIPWNPTGAVFLFGALKLLVIAGAFYKADRALRPFLMALVAFDVATAAALGYARTYMGMYTAISSRYQYIPLLALGTMLGILISGWRRELKILVFAGWIWLLVYRWGDTVDHWAAWRGTQQRTALARNRPYQTFDPSHLTTAEARRLIQRWKLH